MYFNVTHVMAKKNLTKEKKDPVEAAAKDDKIACGFRLSKSVFDALVARAKRQYRGNRTLALEMTLVEAFGLQEEFQ